MLFRVNFQLESLSKRDEAVKRFSEMAGNPDYALPEGLTLIGRWHNVSAHNGTEIWETDDIKLLYSWLALWTDLIVYKCDPVVEDEDAGAMSVELVKRIQA